MFVSPVLRRFLETVLFLLVLRGCRGQGSSRCSLEYDTFNQCVGYSGFNGTSVCYSCVSNYYEDQLSLDLEDVLSYACSTINEETCFALSSCALSCSICEQEFVEFFECESACSLTGTSCKSSDDSSGPGGSSGSTAVPSPSPTSLECPEELGTFRQCMEETGAAKDCVTCINAYTPENITTCAYSEQLSCSLADECPICGDCQDEWVSYTNCLNLGSCSVFTCDAPTLRPSSAPAATPSADPTLAAETEPTFDPGAEVPAACLSFEATLETCLDEEASRSQAESCPSCVEEMYQRLLGGGQSGARSALKCSTIQAGLCDATTSAECDCGSCAAAYQDLIKCRVEDGDADCTFSCDGDPYASPSAASARHFAANGHLVLAPLLFVLAYSAEL